MAVEIDIPEIGRVTAENAASEDTLQQIAKLLKDRSNAISAAGVTRELKNVEKTAGDTESQLDKTNQELKKFGQTLGDLNNNFGNLTNTVKNSEKLFSGFGKQTKQSTQTQKAASESVQNFGDDIDTLGDQVAQANRSISDLSRSAADASVDIGASFASSAQRIADSGDGIAGVTETIKDALGATSNALAGLSDRFGLAGMTFGVGMTAASAFSGFLLAQYDSLTQAFTDVVQNGADFGYSLTRFKEASDRSGLGMQAFGAFVNRNNEALALLEGTVTEAAERLTRSFETLRRGNQQTYREMLLLGHTTEEIQQGLLDVQVINRMSANQRRLTDQQLIATTKDYLTAQKELATLTGVEADAIKQRGQAIMAERSAQAAIASMQPEQAAAMESFVGTMGSLGPNMQELINDYIAFGDATNKQTAATQQQFGPVADEIKRIIGEFKAGRISSAELPALVAGIGDTAKRTADAMQGEAQGLGAAARRGNEFAIGVVDAFNALRKLGLSVGDLESAQKSLAESEEQREKQAKGAGDDLTDSFLNSKEMVKDFRLALDTLTTDLIGSDGFSTVLKRATDALKMFAEVAVKGLDAEIIRIPIPFMDPATNPDGSPKLLKDQLPFEKGTLGMTGQRFVEFGEGTPAILHGSEAVVREDEPAGQLIKAFDAGKLSQFQDGTAGSNMIKNKETASFPSMGQAYVARSKLDHGQTIKIDGEDFVVSLNNVGEKYFQPISDLAKEQFAADKKDFEQRYPERVDYTQTITALGNFNFGLDTATTKLGNLSTVIDSIKVSDVSEKPSTMLDITKGVINKVTDTAIDYGMSGAITGATAIAGELGSYLLGFVPGYEKGTGTASGNSLFKDFGDGTLALLHNQEAVIPKDSEFGKLLQKLQENKSSAPNMSNNLVNDAVSAMVTLQNQLTQGEIKRSTMTSVPKPEAVVEEEKSQDSTRTTQSTMVEQRDKENKEIIKTMSNYQVENLNRLNDIREELVKLNRTSTKTLQTQQ